MDEDSFNQRSTAFLTWLKNQSNVRVSSKISLTDLRSTGTGRGVVALDDIAEDEELFAVPRTAVLSIRNSDLQSRLSTPLSEYGPWLGLILVMLYECLKGEDSLWYPYFQVLPREFDTLMFWTDSELNELQGSAVVHKIGREGAEDSIKSQILPIVRANYSLFPAPLPSGEKWDGPVGESTLLSLAHVMGSLIMAYSFDIQEDRDNEEDAASEEESLVTDDEEDPPKGMVPLADMLNAAADLNNSQLSHEDDVLVMKASSAIQRGKEIFADIGPLPRSDLLRRYGFVSDRYAKYDVVEFSMDLIRGVMGNTDSEAKVQFLGELDLLEDGYAVPRPSSHSTLFDAIPDDLKTAILVFSSPRDSLKKHKIPKAGFTGLHVNLIRELVRRRQAEFSTTLEQDMITLREFQQQSANRSRLRMALEVRIGEKEILGTLLQLARASEAESVDSKKRPVEDQSDTHKKQKKKKKKGRI